VTHPHGTPEAAIQAEEPPLTLPSVLGHLSLLLQLRRDLASNVADTAQQEDRRADPKKKSRPLFAGLSFLLSASPAIPLFYATYRLMAWAPIAESPLWTRFFFDLLSFVCTCVWICWPVLAAEVDDHAELSRFKTLPIPPLRLLLASSLGALTEPLAVILYAPMLGATLALLRAHPPRSYLLAALLFVAWSLFSLAFSRAALHLVLGVMRQKRGAQALGVFFILILLASVFLPPVDVSWLTTAAGNFGALSPAFLLQSIVGLSRVPTGYLGEGLRMLAEGRVFGPMLELSGLLAFACVGFGFAWCFMLQRPDDSRAGSRRGGGGGLGLLKRAGSVERTLVWRELLDLFRNPKARLLFFVPLVLAVAMRLLSMRPLIEFFVGELAQAWILTGLTLYGLTIFSLTFMQNAFGYDGRSLAWLLAAPITPRQIMRAKLQALQLAALLVLLFDCSFFALYFGIEWIGLWLYAFFAGLCLLYALLGIGALVSVRFATRYHAGLERRDQQPRSAILTGLFATSVGAAPALQLLRVREGQPLEFQAVMLLGGAALLYALCYRLARPSLEGFFEARKQRVLHALLKD